MASYRFATSEEPSAGSPATINHEPVISHEPEPSKKNPNRYGMDSYRVATTANDSPKTGGDNSAVMGSLSTVHSLGTENGLSSSTRNLFQEKPSNLGLESCACTRDSLIWIGIAVAGIITGLVLGLIVHFTFYNPMISSKMHRHRRQPLNEKVVLPLDVLNITYEEENSIVQFTSLATGRLSINDVIYDFQKGWVVHRDRDLNLCFVWALSEDDLVSYAIMKFTTERLESQNMVKVNNYGDENFNYTTRNLTVGEKSMLSTSQGIKDLCNSTYASWYVEPVGDDYTHISFCRTCLPQFHLVPFISAVPSIRKRYDIQMKSVICPTYGICP